MLQSQYILGDCVEIKDNNICFNLVDKQALFQNLSNDLNIYKQRLHQQELFDILSNNNNQLLTEYSGKVFNKVYLDKDINDPNVKSGMKLFQTAFLEMEGLFGNMERMQPGKTGFDHVLGVLNNILKSPNPNIDECILALLHDSVEDIPGYTLGHIYKVYGEYIANSINSMTKKLVNTYLRIKKDDNKNALDYLDDPKINNIHQKHRGERYYDDMGNWDKNMINTKFADRLDSLQTMEGVKEGYLQRKLNETKEYFLIDRLKNEDSKFHYNELKKQYNILLSQ